MVSKLEAANIDNHEYTVMSVVQTLQRAFATLRFDHLAGWPTKRRRPAMYARVRVAGTYVAWFSTPWLTSDATLTS